MSSLHCHPVPIPLSPTRHHKRLPCPRLHLFTPKSKPSFALPSLSMPPNRHPFRCSSMSVREDTPTSQLQDSLLQSRAYWVNKFLIAWNVDTEDGSCFLYASKCASLAVTIDGIQGYDVKIKLKRAGGPLPANVLEKFPHIQDYGAFELPPALDAKTLLKCQLAIAIYRPDGRCCDATGLQLPGVLDELFAYTGPLGAVFSEEAISLYLWAPTAQIVRAFLYSEPLGGDPFEIVPLEEVEGVWTAKGPKDWEGCYYVYEVCIYHWTTLQVEKCHANDPYSRGLSSDGRRTLLVNLNSEALKPEEWDKLADEKPHIKSFSDISIYELHIRDFSANDATVPPDVRGGYEAFTLQESAGVQHLKKLSDAGITHVHLLPTYQFAGVDDEKEKWKFVDVKKLEILPPDSDEQQFQITAIQNEDGYNWGYNPVLWGVPKGSYASNPNGPSRTVQFRKMVQALNKIGLRVVMDVVYNHLHASGPFDDNSVLDKIVPGYYLRRNADGFVEHSTCINNTASEHFMVERLIVDDLLCWAVDYKVDGFRFDLMGHIMKRTMLKAKAALHGLSKERDGVDGSCVYIYGEGWDFGEVAKNGRGINACQFNLCGTGIGSFNDRVRDAILGGSPFGHPLQQGFATGLYLQGNGHDHGTQAKEKLMLALSKDHIQVGMAANLRDYVFTNHEGNEVKGSEVLTYDGSSVGYALCPTETVNYVSAHDNETLFDIVSLKTSMSISVDDRCRMNHLATSIIALSQGVPFFHCGDELLRSKSLDRDSYNSGDWFNRIKPRLADPSFKPQRSNILAAMDNFLNLLCIRYSSPLFRLKTANAIQERVRFLNTGPSQIPGVIVMSIEDGHEGVPGLTQLDPIYAYIALVINSRPSEVSFASPALRAKALQLHPVQVMSTDEVVKTSSFEASSGCLTIPARTTSVFVEPRNI